MNTQEETHFAVTIYYTIIWKIQNICQKLKNDSIVKKKAQAVMLISYRRALYNLKTIELKL